MTAVRSAVTRVRQGSGGVLLVVGEAGVGKSRLLTEAARLAARGRAAVLSGRAGGRRYLPGAGRGTAAAAARTTRSGEPVRRRTGPRSAACCPAGRPAGAPRRNPASTRSSCSARACSGCWTRSRRRAACSCSTTCTGPTPDTLALVDYLAAAARPAGAGGRGRPRRRPAAGALDRAARRPGGSTLRLARLGAADVAALAGTRAAGPLPDELSALVERADGLPLLVEELVDAAVRTPTAPDVAARPPA